MHCRQQDSSPTTLAAARLQRMELLGDRQAQELAQMQGLVTKLRTRVGITRQDVQLPLRRVCLLSVRPEEHLLLFADNEHHSSSCAAALCRVLLV